MSNASIMKKLDTLIFKEINKLENSESYQKVSDTYSSLEDNVQKVVKSLLMAAVIILPLLIVLLFKLSNNSLTDNLNIKKDLVISANTLIKSKSDMKRTSRVHIGRQFVESSEEIKKNVQGMLNLAGIDSSKVKISNIDINSEAALITKVKADVKFDGMSNNDIFSFLTNLTSKLKIRLDEISIKKNNTTKLLDGVFTMYYFSKAEILDE